MSNTKKIGDRGEAEAALALERNCYEILSRNYRTKFGEIDIIARDGDTLVFVEVKSKSGKMYGTPGEMIDWRKLRKLKNMALNFVSETKFEGPIRIDAVLILGQEIQIIKNITS